jgi:hypothetical protein
MVGADARATMDGSERTPAMRANRSCARDRGAWNDRLEGVVEPEPVAARETPGRELIAADEPEEVRKAMPETPLVVDPYTRPPR